MNVLQAIIDKLAEHYPAANIYVNDIEQGAKEPCFFVKMNHQQTHKSFRHRHKVRALFNVVYLDDKVRAQELHEMAGELSVLLANVGCYAEAVDSDISDDSISISITYHYFIKEQKEPSELMAENKLIQKKERGK